MKRVLITGAGGFIGIKLTEHLLLSGYDVIPVDFADGDLRVDGVADYLIKSNKPDVVVHLAAQVGILFNEGNLVHSIESNVIVTLRVALACQKYGVKMIHTSTSEVYGDMGEKMLEESEPLVGNVTGMYALSKRWSEDIIKEYVSDWVIIRPSMPYGTGSPVGVGRRAMDNMLWQAHHRKPIIVHKNSVRSWCHISDLCAGYEAIIRDDASGVYNVGRDDDERTMLEIAQRACDLAGAPYSLIVEVEPKEKKTMIKRLSTKKLQSHGWYPKIEIEEGMAELYEWVKRYKWKD